MDDKSNLLDDLASFLIGRIAKILTLEVVIV